MARYTGAMRRTGYLVAVVALVVSANAATAEVALAPGEIVIADRGGAGLDAEYAVLHDLPPRLFDFEVSSLLFHVYRQAVAGRRPAAPRRLSPERFETNLRRFVEVGREIGARVVFVDFHYRDAARGQSPGEPLPNPLMAVDSIEALHALHDEYQRVVERVAVATDTPFVRTAAALHAVEAEAFTDWDATHPTPAGQRVIARAILDEVERMGVLPARGAR